MKVFIILISIFCFSATDLLAQNTDIDQVCKDALYQAKLEIDDLILSDPSAYGMLNLGVVNEDSLTLEFNYRDTSAVKMNPSLQEKRIRKQKAHFQGLKLRLDKPHRPGLHIFPLYCWNVLDLHLNAKWSWANGRFSFDSQRAIMQAANRAFEPLFTLENDSLSSILGDAGQKSFSLEGRNAPTFLIDLDTNRNGMLQATLISKSFRKYSISQRFNYQVIVDNKMGITRLPSGFINRVYLKKDKPFIELRTGYKTTLFNFSPPRLSPGIHRIRIVASFDTNFWWDMTPTFVDGQEIKRIIDSYWVGRIMSNEIKVMVDKDGIITALSD